MESFSLPFFKRFSESAAGKITHKQGDCGGSTGSRQGCCCCCCWPFTRDSLCGNSCFCRTAKGIMPVKDLHRQGHLLAPRDYAHLSLASISWLLSLPSTTLLSDSVLAMAMPRAAGCALQRKVAMHSRSEDAVPSQGWQWFPGHWI